MVVEISIVVKDVIIMTTTIETHTIQRTTTTNSKICKMKTIVCSTTFTTATVQGTIISTETVLKILTISQPTTIMEKTDHGDFYVNIIHSCQSHQKDGWMLLGSILGPRK